LIESYGDAAGLSIMHNSNGGILGYANLGEGDARNTFYISSGHADIGHHGLVMNNSGKVGLGLPMPEARLHLLDESERQLRLEKSGKNSGHIDIGADTKGLYIVGNRDNSLGDLPLLSIINNGSVGIGVDFWEMHKFSAYPGENTLFLRNAHGGLNSQMEILNKAHESRFRMRSLLDHSTLDDQWIFSTITDENAFVIQDDGNIGIGTRTLNDDYLLTINGGMIAKDVVVQSNIWADFVFEPGYELMPLEALDSFVKSNRHLPDIPSEADVLENGVSLKDMQVKLLQKVEELTLYTIQLNEQNKGLMQRVNLLEKRLNKLESQ